MLRVGVTGQSGFVGSHLFNTLGLNPDKFSRIPFEDSFFDDPARLEGFISSCEVVIHLAAVNRHPDPEWIYNTNISLVRKLIDACIKTNSIPHILFSSSTQEERDNPYGRSKKEGREMLEKWAERSGAKFTGMIIPNIFGPFCLPKYNSVVATFCHQLTHNEMPRIDVDTDLRLIYVNELVAWILKRIESEVPDTSSAITSIEVPYTSSIKVSELLERLKLIHGEYFSEGKIPDLSQEFNKNLFNTFLTYVDHKSLFPFNLRLNSDNRGSFVEVIRLNNGGQISFSTTRPGITRGNHFHTRKAERFAVIKGNARIELRRIGTTDKKTFLLNGNNPSFVDMPVWFTHNITNIGLDDVYTFFWINESYNPSDPDTYYEEV